MAFFAVSKRFPALVSSAMRSFVFMRGFAIFLDKRGDTVGFRFWPATGQTIQFVPINAAHWHVGGIRQSAGRRSSFRRHFSFCQFHKITLSLCPAFASSSRQTSWQATILRGDFFTNIDF